MTGFGPVPSTSVPSETQFPNSQHRGTASISFRGRTLRFRTNPNEVWWSYQLKTSVEQTYGGRVVQILGVGIDELSLKIDCGRGGWPYLTRVVDFLRQVMIDQRKGGDNIGEFRYTTRNWHMKVFALAVPYQDTVTATVRELELRFKVQEDVSGVQSQAAMSLEMARLQDGIGFRKSQYNTPQGGGEQGENPQWTNGEYLAPGNLLNTVRSFAGVGGGLGLGLLPI